MSAADALVTLTIDGESVSVPEGTTILQACGGKGCGIPTLCYGDTITPKNACRVCMVAAEGVQAPLAACTSPCREDMKVDTTDETSRRIAAATVELVLSELPEPPAEHTELAGLPTNDSTKSRSAVLGETDWLVRKQGIGRSIV